MKLYQTGRQSEFDVKLVCVCVCVCVCVTRNLMRFESIYCHFNETRDIQVWVINPYPTAFPYGNGMVLHFYQQQESSTTKTVYKVINKGLKTYV